MATKKTQNQASVEEETPAEAQALVMEETPKVVEEPAEDMVSIRLPVTKENSGPVFVRVNTRTWGIPRGVPVEVPVCVAEVLEHAETAEMEAIAYQKANEKES